MMDKPETTVIGNLGNTNGKPWKQKKQNTRGKHWKHLGHTWAPKKNLGNTEKHLGKKRKHLITWKHPGTI